jgi:hypothetical protein
MHIEIFNKMLIIHFFCSQVNIIFHKQEEC